MLLSAVAGIYISFTIMALFGRRKPRHFFKKVKEVLWPSQGWRRTFRYYRHRIFRTGDTTYKIAAGLALGMALSFVPLLGTHLLQAAFFGFLMRTSFIAAFLGTALGNPWTFPFLFWLAYKVGSFLMISLGWTDLATLPDFMNRDYFASQPMAFMHYLLDYPLQLFLPMLLGGYVCALLFWPLAYGVLYYPVKLMRHSYNSEKTKRFLHRK
ncbi:MAG: DUF2062 domain-containing protein [Alphaproteobacteria bacterium CG_4_9_14_3_um_filter_47_13]|nr:MAG: DUF2062 domain-containing protein [Alphaproteobacteria bacterium CG_4_9_14_3_um_filter_47_13]